MYKIEIDVPIHKVVYDFMNCSKIEACEKCSCSNENNRFICGLLSYYRDTLIQKILEIS